MSEPPGEGSGRRLAFADDGSPGADVAWLWIDNHPWPGWTIDALTGANPPYDSSTWGVPPDLAPWDPPWSREYRGHADLGALRRLRAEVDPRLLLDAQSDADLVVVGRRGLGRVRAAWMGSTSEWLLHHPTAPLAIIGSGTRTERVVCCADGSPHARRAAAALAALPLAQQAAVTVLAVDDGRVDVGAALTDVGTTLAAAGIEVATEQARGKATDVILEHLDANRPQLVVLGTRGLTGWRRLRLGSTASAVVHHSTAATLVACAEDEASEES